MKKKKYLMVIIPIIAVFVLVVGLIANHKKNAFDLSQVTLKANTDIESIMSESYVKNRVEGFLEEDNIDTKEKKIVACEFFITNQSKRELEFVEQDMNLQFMNENGIELLSTIDILDFVVDIVEDSTFPYTNYYVVDISKEYDELAELLPKTVTGISYKVSDTSYKTPCDNN